MLPVTAASVVDVVDVVESKNREQNGKGVQNANRDAGADAVADALSDAVRVCFLGLNQDVENPRSTMRPKFGGVSLAAALPAHPLSVLSMLFSRKIANKTLKEFKMQIGKHLGKRRDAILGKHGKHHSVEGEGDEAPGGEGDSMPRHRLRPLLIAFFLARMF